MKIHKTTFTFFFLFFSILQAHEADPIINDNKKKYEINIPLDKNLLQEFIREPDDKSYEYYDRCYEPTNFKIIDLAMVLEYVWVGDDDLGFFNVWDQYDCQFHVVRVNYEITCSNNRLTYAGTEYLISDVRIEENEYDFDGRGVKMKNQGYTIWENVPIDYLNANGTITRDVKYGEWSHYTIAKLDTSKIINKWIGQKVSYPEHKYIGVPGKLPRPVLFIHGLNDTYDVWGVKPIYDKNKFSDNDKFIKGEVSKYEKGSLPDMLARSNNLYTESNDSAEYSINNNGIYFFQSPRRKEKSNDEYWIYAEPQWKENKDNSQSYALYIRITEVMDDFYGRLGISWRDSASAKYQIDLVGHSQGGLVIREMLRGLPNDPSDANAANHINKIITVNTPHYGSALATPDGNEILENGYDGLALMINNIKTKQKYELLTADVENSALEGIAGFAGGFYDGWKLIDPDYQDGDNEFLTAFEYIGAFIMGILGSVPSSIYGSDIEVTMKGPYLGAYDFDIEIKQLFSDKSLPTIKNIDLLKDSREDIIRRREDGKHLYKNSDFMSNLNNGDKIFPHLPNGNKAILLPMYSDSSNKILRDVFYSMAINASRLCAEQKLGTEGCLGVTSAIGKMVKKYSYNLLSVSDADISDNLWEALVNVQETWLKGSDGFVEVNSQKFFETKDVKPFSDPEYENYFLEPRTYAIHNALAPDEPVLHGKAFGNDGAARQGLDLLCALSPACDNAFAAAQATQGSGSSVLILSKKASNNGFNESFLEVSGDFSLAPIYISEGIQAFSLSLNGETILNAKYEPAKGSSITVKNGETVQTELVLDSTVASQPSISRRGDSVFVYFTNYSGKPFRRDYFLPGLSANLVATVIAESGAAMSPVIIGKATATNPETQKPPTPPPGHRLAPVTLAILHREARGEHESNTSRPRFLVYNATKDTLEFSRIAYYFTADPARIPKIEVDYPYIPVSLENLGGDKWRFVLDAGIQKIAPRSFYPSADGWQTRLHYSDWFEYEHLNDWSADYSIGLAKFNSKIVIYDRNGKIIWGNEPPEFEGKDNDIIPMPKGIVTWQDDAPWEMNIFKPRVTVENRGSIAFSNYHAQLWFSIPQGKNISIPSPDDWYTPESQPSVSNVGGRVWKLDLYFDKHILYPGASVSEGNIGLHLTDWSGFDKTVCGIALKDNEGNILFGREPSVEECESYGEQNLLQFAIHSRRFEK